MKGYIRISLIGIVVACLLTSCEMLPMGGNADLEGTQVAIAVQQTSLAMQQSQVDQPAPAEREVQIQPTYTPYPTYTVQVQAEVVIINPTSTPEPTYTTEPIQTEEIITMISFEDWLEDVEILLYDDMYGEGEPLVIENALDGLGLGSNTTNVKDAMGDFLRHMNSGINWDLIIVGAESRDNISGEYFDVIADQIDRDSSFIF